ncbi:hypothetical protein OG705_23925 [Streptomyces sp. NBC_00838]|uniref:hypothetical protein n=1 Tax=Streptomyces sp. NBC_00838 TaxID=2903680 RepID=UPI00386E407B|nr:hypothetical protein [Streptomyces sp. NP-1717]WTA75693.1 hypothetical protein OG705_23925 [Streptomyces sp. NBC_00838]
MAALVTGLLLGAGGVGAAWAIAGDGSADTSGAAVDARGACDALAGFDETKFTAKGDEGLVALNRWSGAVTLSAAAAAGDPAYESLSDSLSRAQHRHAQVFDFDAEVKKDLAKARGICEDL